MTGVVQDAVPSLVGRSPLIDKVRELIPKAAAANAPVLLLGESGTGKEVVARAVHASGRGGPFIPIDCGALVGPLMESELFGHVKGAFTSAAVTKLGLVEMANGGTAFFDEIGDLPLDLQVKLLRLLQEREYRPVGATASRRADIRVIAATHRDLEQAVRDGRFREDLYYRLNVVKVRLPALRDRKEDIAELTAFFLRKMGSTKSVSAEVWAALRRHDWPGNVRELENCVSRMVALSPGPMLSYGDLPSQVRNSEEAEAAQSMFAAAGAGSRASAKLPVVASLNLPVVPLAQVERNAILHALEFTKGDRTVAATLLGIGRTTLYRKLREYRLSN